MWLSDVSRDSQWWWFVSYVCGSWGVLRKLCLGYTMSNFQLEVYLPSHNKKRRRILYSHWFFHGSFTPRCWSEDVDIFGVCICLPRAVLHFSLQLTFSTTYVLSSPWWYSLEAYEYLEEEEEEVCGVCGIGGGCLGWRDSQRKRKHGPAGRPWSLAGVNLFLQCLWGVTWQASGSVSGPGFLPCDNGGCGSKLSFSRALVGALPPLLGLFLQAVHYIKSAFFLGVPLTVSKCKVLYCSQHFCVYVISKMCLF